MAQVVLKGIEKIYYAPNARRRFLGRRRAKFRDVIAVQDFNLVIDDKEFVVLVGPSGCGKSTTLRMIAGLEEITDGDLFIDGKRMNNVAPKDRDIAMVFQNYALYPHMTVFKNMAFSLELRHEKKTVIAEKVRRAAEILEITDLLNRKPLSLSGGQRQRVAIGRAIVRAPKVFLMDEPLSNLDAKLREQMRSELVELRHRIDATFVYVTHDQVEAMTLGDRIVIMKDGFVQQIGSPQEVFDHPANMFVAGFIGTPQMNFIPARLFERSGVYNVQWLNQEIQLNEELQMALRNNTVTPGSITMGIRPEHISLLPEGGVEASVKLSEMMGSSVHLHLSLAGLASDSDVVALIPTLGQHTSFSYGDTVNIQVNASCIHLFDPASGAALDNMQKETNIKHGLA